MPAEKYILHDRAAWLAARQNHIGGCRSMCWEEPAQG